MKKLIVLLVFAMLVVSSLSLGFTGKASAIGGGVGDALEVFLEEQAARGEVTSSVAEEKKAPKEYRVLEPGEEKLSEQLIEKLAAGIGGF